MQAEAVLDAEMQIGKLTAAMPKASHDRGNQYTGGKQTTVSDSQKPKTEALKEIGISEKQAQRFETLAKHPEIVEQAKESARRTKERSRSIPKSRHKYNYFVSFYFVKHMVYMA